MDKFLFKELAMYNGKVRGQRRKLKKLLNNIEEIKAYQNLEFDMENKYEHFHVPCTPWIERPKTYSKIKTAFCKVWIRKTEEIINTKPEGLQFCKVVCNICVPNLWDSQIIIFYDKDYYDSFWDRHGGYQDWSKIQGSSSLIKERWVTTNLKETGYIETIIDEDSKYTSYMWFYGEQEDCCL